MSDYRQLLAKPDTWIYLVMFVVFTMGIALCILPLLRVRRALKRGEKQLSARRSDGSYLYDYPDFLRCKWLNHSWKCYLINLDAIHKSNGVCNVQDYINPKTAIQEPGHAAFGEMIPGVLTTLGILGSFYGIVQGLSMLDLTTSETMSASIAVLIGGMRTAFNTSIVGAILALVFQLMRRLIVGLASRTLSHFVQSCDAQISTSLSEEAALNRTIHAILTEIRRLNETLQRSAKE